MNISLDEQIRKDKERDRLNSRHYQPRNQNNHRNRHYSGDRQQRYQRQDRPHREQRSVIHITNLHYSVTRQQLQELCEKFGNVKSCRIEWDKMGRSNEKANVEYFSKAQSEAAVEKLRGTVFQEQPIQAQLVEEDNGPSKRHEIRKNYGNRFNQFSSNFRQGNRKK